MKIKWIRFKLPLKHFQVFSLQGFPCWVQSSLILLGWGRANLCLIYLFVMRYRKLRGDIFLGDEQCKRECRGDNQLDPSSAGPKQGPAWGCYSKKCEFESINKSVDVFQTSWSWQTKFLGSFRLYVDKAFDSLWGAMENNDCQTWDEQICCD